MLSAFDDYPIHQTVSPVAHTATSDANVYDRYFFQGADRLGETIFGAGLAIYPNRDIIDASFSVATEGRQHSLHASGRLHPGSRITSIGPITVEVVRPLHSLRIIIDGPHADELGMHADLTFSARTVAVEEPRHTATQGARTILDATRLTQWGDWSGTISVDGAAVRLDPLRHVGLRDRSWGVRPLGDATPGAPSHDLPQVFWVWSPIRFDDHCLHAGVNEHADGRRWFQFGERTALIDPGLLDPDGGAHALVDTGGLVEPLRAVDYDIDWEPGTRRARSAVVTFHPWNRSPQRVELTPLAPFFLRGLGYINPDWMHGAWKGELAVGRESWRPTDLDPTDVHNLHIQQLCRASCDGREGIAVLEQLALGPHEPSGLTGFLDGAG